MSQHRLQLERMGQKKTKEKKKEILKTSKFQLQHNRYHSKNFNKANPTIPRKIINGDMIGPSICPKASEFLLLLDLSYQDIFLWYLWCCNRL